MGFGIQSRHVPPSIAFWSITSARSVWVIPNSDTDKIWHRSEMTSSTYDAYRPKVTKTESQSYKSDTDSICQIEVKGQKQLWNA